MTDNHVKIRKYVSALSLIQQVRDGNKSSEVDNAKEVTNQVCKQYYWELRARGGDVRPDARWFFPSCQVVHRSGQANHGLVFLRRTFHSRYDDNEKSFAYHPLSDLCDYFVGSNNARTEVFRWV